MDRRDSGNNTRHIHNLSIDTYLPTYINNCHKPKMGGGHVESILRVVPGSRQNVLFMLPIAQIIGGVKLGRQTYSKKNGIKCSIGIIC